MRDLKEENGAQIGDGGGSGSVSPEAAKKEEQKQPAQKAAADWWEGFAKAVEDPRISTYEYLRGSITESLGVTGARSLGDFLSKAQQKAFKEVIQLTKPEELRDAFQKLERNRLLFDARTRVGIQCMRVLLDTYLSAREEYETDMAKRKAKGEKAPTEEEQKKEIEKIVEEKLADKEVAASIEKAAEALTGLNKEDIEQTVDKASQQLRTAASLKKMSTDLIGVSKKYFTFDNAANLAIVALPLITWQYRWALALGLGAFASRKAVYHGYKATEALIRKNPEVAKEEGHKTLTAMKAAGGNVIAIGIAPAAAKLPAKFAIWTAFAANYVYGKSLEIGQNLLKKKDPVEEGVSAEAAEGVQAGEAEKKKKKGVFGAIKKFFSENLDTLVTLTLKTLNKSSYQNHITKKMETTSTRVQTTKARSFLGNVFMVASAAGRRATTKLKDAWYRANPLERPRPSPEELAAQKELEEKIASAANDNPVSKTGQNFADAASDEATEEPATVEREINEPEKKIMPPPSGSGSSPLGPS